MLEAGVLDEVDAVAGAFVGFIGFRNGRIPFLFDGVLVPFHEGGGKVGDVHVGLGLESDVYAGDFVGDDVADVVFVGEVAIGVGDKGEGTAFAVLRRKYQKLGGGDPVDGGGGRGCDGVGAAVVVAGEADAFGDVVDFNLQVFQVLGEIVDDNQELPDFSFEVESEGVGAFGFDVHGAGAQQVVAASALRL